MLCKARKVAVSITDRLPSQAKLVQVFIPCSAALASSSSRTRSASCSSFVSFFFGAMVATQWLSQLHPCTSTFGCATYHQRRKQRKQMLNERESVFTRAVSWDTQWREAASHVHAMWNCAPQLCTIVHRADCNWEPLTVKDHK